MISAYLKFTSRYTRWFLYTLLEFFGPAIGAVSGVFGIGGLISFLFWSFYLAMSLQPVPHGKLVLFSCFGAGLAGFALREVYQNISLNAYLRAMYGEKDEEREADTWIVRVRNRFELMAIYAVCAWVSYLVFQLRNLLEVLTVGLFMFMLLGNVLGALRWLVGLGMLARIKSHMHEVRTSITSRNKPSAVVVPFRRRK